MARDRTIPQAIDKISGELLLAGIIFKGGQKAAEIRKLYNENKLWPICRECNQKLQISKSSIERHYFKHFSGSETCLLKDSSLTEKESGLINAIICAKESDRHKYLKNKITELLLQTEGVDKESIYTDDRFIFTGKQKRRPDVYCQYKDKKIVFEIQLSDLSYRYILDRHNFYKEKGIYLVWILDNFNVNGQSTMEKDIKYLTAYQNFFRLDESKNYFQLHCTYKLPFVSGIRILTPWKTKVVSLQEITFSPDTNQIYYFDFDTKLKEEEIALAVKLKETAKSLHCTDGDAGDYSYEDYELELYEKDAENRVMEVIKRITFCREKNLPFTSVEKLLEDFYTSDFDTLNEKLAFKTRIHADKPLMNFYISKAGKLDYSFLSFLLKEKRILIAVNAKDVAGTTIFQELFLNKELAYRETLIYQIFKRGYQLLSADLELLNSDQVDAYNKNADVTLFKLYQKLSDKESIDIISCNKSVFYVIESAKQQKMIYFNFTNWIAFGVNAIYQYRPHWSYIELALKKYEVWEKIIQEDRKGTFNKKLIAFRDELPEQDKSIAPVIKDLYPELYL